MYSEELELHRNIIYLKPSTTFCNVADEDTSYKGLGYQGKLGFDIKVGFLYTSPNIGYAEIKANIPPNDYFIKHYLSLGVDFKIKDMLIDSYIGIGATRYILIDKKIEYENPDFYISFIIGMQKEIGVSGIFFIPEIRFSYSLNQRSVIDSSKNVFLIDLSFGIGYALTSY
jgi:hypothetical protein